MPATIPAHGTGLAADDLPFYGSSSAVMRPQNGSRRRQGSQIHEPLPHTLAGPTGRKLCRHERRRPAAKLVAGLRTTRKPPHVDGG